MFAYNEFYLNHVFLSQYSFFPTICFSIRTLVVVFEGVNLRTLIATAFAATALYSYITFFWGVFFFCFVVGGGVFLSWEPSYCLWLRAGIGAVPCKSVSNSVWVLLQVNIT